MVPPDVYRMWERQRENARTEQRLERARKQLEAARLRARVAREILAVT